MAIDRDKFALMCVQQAMFFEVNAHYLAALAELLSGIKDESDGDRIGAFRRTKTEWAAKGTAPEFEVELQPEDIESTRMQCTFAALQTRRAQDQFLQASGGKYPNAIQLYAIWPNDP